MKSNENLLIDNTIICKNFMGLDFENIEIGQQIIVFKSEDIVNYNHKKIKYNDFDIYLLKDKKIKNAYIFDKIETNIRVYNDIYYDDYDCLEMYCNSELDCYYYLKIKKDILEISDIELCNFDNCEDFEDDINKNKENYNKFKEMYKEIINIRSKSNKYIEIINKLENKNIYNGDLISKYNLKDYFLIDLKGSFLGIYIENEIIKSKYTWEKNIYYYLFDESFDKCAMLDISKKQSLQLIDFISKNYSNYDNEQCLKNLKIYNFKLNDLRLSLHNKQLVIDTLLNHSIYEANEVINQFLNAIYVDKELNISIYLNDIDFGTYPTISYNDFEKSDDPNIKHKQNLVLKKGESVLEYLTGTSFIDIYTGEVINHNYEKVYEDYEYIQLCNKKRNSNLYFKKIDDELFIRLLFSKEIDLAINEIKDRKNVYDTLIQ